MKTESASTFIKFKRPNYIFNFQTNPGSHLKTMSYDRTGGYFINLATATTSMQNPFFTPAKQNKNKNGKMKPSSMLCVLASAQVCA